MTRFIRLVKFSYSCERDSKADLMQFNSISGQEGNSAIETAASLATEIFNMLKAQPEGVSPSDTDITAAFQKGSGYSARQTGEDG